LAFGILAAAVVLLFTQSPLWRLPFYLASLSIFHFLEFWTTAAYNTRVAEVDSFLLTANWPAYGIAHGIAALECAGVGLLFPHRQWSPFGTGNFVLLLGLALTVVGQVVRSVAMMQAGPSFNHTVQSYRGQEHVLVTTGIYARLRHPSYFGYFWWALGVQISLGNVFSFFLHGLVLWRFFSSRVRYEEASLIKFFGDEYVNYRKQVGTKIPFIP
jgi:protein-S-isoprenylcysteine O-methyltransferase